MGSPSKDKELFWLTEKVTSPPLSSEARVETGFYLRKLQQGDSLGMPHSRPMPSIGKRCHELRITDSGSIWRVFYRVDSDAIVIVEWFSKRTRETPKSVIDLCRKRLKHYDALCLKAALSKPNGQT
jgi:phage-related protein